jgi:hypothetical protein
VDPKPNNRAIGEAAYGTSGSVRSDNVLAGGLGPHRAACKVNRYFRPGKCFHKVGAIDLGRPQQDSDTIERHKVARERQNPAGDFDALTSLSRRREYFDFVAGLDLRRLLMFVEKMSLEPRKSVSCCAACIVRAGCVVEILDLETESIAKALKR